jgi:hypothetical protein
MSALGGTRTPNLLIRRLIRAVHGRSGGVFAQATWPTMFRPSRWRPISWVHHGYTRNECRVRYPSEVPATMSPSTSMLIRLGSRSAVTTRSSPLRRTTRRRLCPTISAPKGPRHEAARTSAERFLAAAGMFRRTRSSRRGRDEDGGGVRLFRRGWPGPRGPGLPGWRGPVEHRHDRGCA